VQWIDLDYRTVAMPQQLEAFKLAEIKTAHGSRLMAHGSDNGPSDREPCTTSHEPMDREPCTVSREPSLSPRRLTLPIFAATALAAIASWIAILAIYYQYGATTPRGGNSWRLEQGRLPFDLLTGWLYNPQDTDWTSVHWIGIGGAITAALVYMRARFLWWPLHPSGFALAHAGLALTWVWFPMFMGWAAKGLILHYGGMKLYRAWIPFFLGLLLGDVVIGVLWAIVGAALNMNIYMFFPG
jgi:hypothetical protein